MPEFESIDPAERRQALQQWLEQVPDEPVGLLRNKLQAQFEQLPEAARQSPKPW